MRCVQGQEHFGVRAMRTAVCEVSDERLAHLDREREAVPAPSLAPYIYLTRVPVDVAQLHGCHLG